LRGGKEFFAASGTAPHVSIKLRGRFPDLPPCYFSPYPGRRKREGDFAVKKKFFLSLQENPNPEDSHVSGT
jgi:hypothetical protein